MPKKEGTRNISISLMTNQITTLKREGEGREEGKEEGKGER